MRTHLLDTPLVAAVLNNRPAAVSFVRPLMQEHQVATSILVYAEVVEYVKDRPDYSERLAALRSLFREVYPYFLTYRILERYAEVRRRLRPPNGPGLIGDVDTLIAATALERNLTVVTTDSDFERVPDLKVRIVPRSALATR